MSKENFQFRGFGLGFRPCHFENILQNRPQGLDWLEVISENFMGAGGLPQHFLRRARENYPIAFHGVGLSIGSPQATRPGYLKLLKELIDLHDPFLISDHLSFSSYYNRNSHDLLPIPYTLRNLELIQDKINIVQDFIQRPLLLENPSAYVAYRSSDIPEDEFLMSLCKSTGCGILLDLNNLFVNQSNLGLCPEKYLETLDFRVVGQIHLSGHSIETSEYGTVRVDTHDHPICPEVWQLFAKAKQKFTRASVMVEWDDKIPPLEELMAVLNQARAVYESHSSDAKLSPVKDNPRATPLYEEDCAQRDFFSLVVQETKVHGNDPLLRHLSENLPVPAFLGSRVYSHAYLGRIKEGVANTFTCLRTVLSEYGYDKILRKYLIDFPPTTESANDLGCDLAPFLSKAHFPDIDFGVSEKALSHIAAFDWARHEAFMHPSTREPLPPSAIVELTDDQWSTVRFTVHPTLNTLNILINPLPILEVALGKMELGEPEFGDFNVVVWRPHLEVKQRIFNPLETSLLQGILKGESFFQVVQTTSQIDEDRESSFDEKVQRYSEILLHFFQLGMIAEILTPAL